MKLSRLEQETIINFNAGEDLAILYTRDPAVMKKVDTLVNGYPGIFRLVSSTDIDRTYVMPKSAISYRKPRKISDAQREAARHRMRVLNSNEKAESEDYSA